ncbi:induced myeloid leukemia cell differentiation protein Mcl-1b [Stigmatopora nigra]
MMSLIQTTNHLQAVFPQNEVVDGSFNCVSTAAASLPDLQRAAATLDAVNGSGAAAKQRPCTLEIKNKDTVTSKNHRGSDEDDGEDSQGSALGTPNMAEEHDGGNDALVAETRRLISRFLREFSGLSTARWNENRNDKTMKRAVTSLLEKFKYKYNGIVDKLSLDERGDNMAFVGSVAKSLFSDGVTNWGRVVSLMAFGAVVSKYLKDKDRGHCVDMVAEEISSYLLTYQRNWLLKNNSWDGFVQFFRVHDPEVTLRSTLMAFAGVAGIGAALALLIR